MRCVIQRVDSAHVEADGQITGKIGPGLLIYLALSEEDSFEGISQMIFKILQLRIFPDDNGKMNLSLMDKGYSCLLVSQFTLYADCRKGNRPYYGNVAKPEKAKVLYEAFEKELSKHCFCAAGFFGAFMKVHAVNSGPVTILLEMDRNRIV
ncbi:MAG: D-tyrosyl-tRNA(Tyr) deacylase [Candidatus Aureabacteria bacterium]|nr:D-tyrosyl-tRNA(Tyr) deacylase [Candidatus Auribacterota bacterium]